MIEKTILSHLVKNEKYTRKVLPFIKPEYFQDRTERVIFEHVFQYVDRYTMLKQYPSVRRPFNRGLQFYVRQQSRLLMLINAASVRGFGQTTALLWHGH